MASQVFNKGKADMITSYFTTGTIKAALVMTNTTVDTENDGKATVSAFTTLDECDATGYARLTLGTKVVNVDDANDRAIFNAANLAFTGLSGNATRDIQGVLIYKHVTNDADSIPLMFIDFTSDIPKTATEIDIPWDAIGILLLS